MAGMGLLKRWQKQNMAQTRTPEGARPSCDTQAEKSVSLELGWVLPLVLIWEDSSELWNPSTVLNVQKVIDRRCYEMFKSSIDKLVGYFLYVEGHFEANNPNKVQ